MKKYNNSNTTTTILSILFILFLITDYFLLKHYDEFGGNTLIVLIFWGIFTILFGCGIIYNIKKESKYKKARKLKDKGLAQSVNAKVIRFNLDHFFGSEQTAKKYYSFTVSDGKNQFTSEPFNGSVFGYNPMKLANLHTIGINYDISKIEETINELEQIKTGDDIKKYIENNSYILGGSFNILHSMAGGGLYEGLLYKINECKEYLKEISKSTEFKNSYLQHKSHQIHIGDNITVYVDPNDSTVYQVNTDFLYD